MRVGYKDVVCITWAVYLPKFQQSLIHHFDYVGNTKPVSMSVSRLCTDDMFIVCTNRLGTRVYDGSPPNLKMLSIATTAKRLSRVIDFGRKDHMRLIDTRMLTKFLRSLGVRRHKVIYGK